MTNSKLQPGFLKRQTDSIDITERLPAHTQGPWHIGVRQPNSDKFVYGPNGEEIADCDREANFAGENLSNARLIAAAPELLDALRIVLNADSDLPTKVKQIALAAIAKATA